MNHYLLFIITFILFEYLLNFYSTYLNMHYLKLTIPKQFIGFYNKKKYTDSQKYTIDSASFQLIVSTLNIIITIIFIVCGGFNYLDIAIRKSNIENEIVLGIVYCIVLISINFILSIPSSYYSTFKIEQKYEFNKSTKKLFFLDQIKMFFISILMTTIIMFFIFYFFEAFNNKAWIYSWIILSVFIIIAPILYINWIAPIFNNFTKIEEGTLKNEIYKLAKKTNFPIKEIYIVDGSKRSSHSNAYFAGFGKNKRIVLFDTLLSNHTNKEIVAIVAHEIGHYKKKHILYSTIISILSFGLMFLCLSFFMNNPLLFKAFKMNNISIYASIVFFIILYSPISLILGILMNYISRRNEYEADEFSIYATNDKNSLILALKNLSVSNLSNLTPHPFYVFLNYTHPPILSRIKAIEKL